MGRPERKRRKESRWRSSLSDSIKAWIRVGCRDANARLPRLLRQPTGAGGRHLWVARRRREIQPARKRDGMRLDSNGDGGWGAGAQMETCANTHQLAIVVSRPPRQKHDQRQHRPPLCHISFEAPRARLLRQAASGVRRNREALVRSARFAAPRPVKCQTDEAAVREVARQHSPRLDRSSQEARQDSSKEKQERKGSDGMPRRENRAKHTAGS